MRWAVTWTCSFCFWASAGLSEDSFQSLLKQASPAIEERARESAKLVEEGEWKAGNDQLMAAFPDDKRTAAESFVLGNLLFRSDPDLAYRLHEAAYKEFPDEPHVQLEWALEQHRAKKYPEAAALYESFLKTSPDLASFHGLHAECLLRQGKVAEAAQAWQRSERAQTGTLVEFESLVCEVNAGFAPDRDRHHLREKATQGSVDHAIQLLLHDIEYRTDWWNAEPRVEWIQRDIQLLRETKFADQKAISELTGLAEAVIRAQAEDVVAEEVRAILKTAGLIASDVIQLPHDDRLVSLLVDLVEDNQLMPKSEMVSLWEKTIHTRAQASKNAELYNVLAHWNVGTDRMQSLSLEGWESTGDVRFAISYFIEAKTLAWNDPQLEKAITQFPDNSILASLRLSKMAQANQPVQEPLIAAILAEYRGFSMGGPLTPRPSAKKLRAMFKELVRLQNEP